MARRWLKCAASLGLCGFALAGGCMSGADGKATVEGALSQKPEAKVFPKAPRFSPVPLRKGQWARYLVGRGTVTPGVYTIKILGPGDLPYSFWFEEEWRQDGDVRVARSQILMDESRVAVVGQAREGFEPVVTDYGRNVRTLLSINGGSVTEIPRNDLPPGLVVLQTRVAFFGGAEIGRARKALVPAGEFKGCYDVRGTMVMNGREGPVAGCADNGVPIHGLVDGRDPLGRQWELLASGFSGATSALP